LNETTTLIYDLQLFSVPKRFREWDQAAPIGLDKLVAMDDPLPTKNPEDKNGNHAG
jgi:hypothetical protein